MKKRLKRLLDRLRTVTEGRFRKPTATREGLQQPQRLDALPARRRV
ncbi:MAG TPA: hypothetical protein VFB26_01690 [Gaiellaceae bacterium]|jgi:hypothetical protein|nr:hypothetical protein [Gaiellaceae bacterium]